MSKPYVPSGGMSLSSFSNISWEDDQDDWNEKAQRIQIRAWRKLKNEMKQR